MPTSDRAICLHAADWSETSQVVHMLTREGGVVRLLAKGAKRAKSKAGGALDLLAEGQLVYSGAGRETLGTLIEFDEATCRPGLRKRLDRLNAGLYMLEVSSALLAETDPHPEVFDLLHNALERMEKPDAAPHAVLAYFQWRLLRHVGLLGEMQACVGCGWPASRASLAGTGPTGVYFASSAGGLLCRNCQASASEKYIVTASTLAGLSTLIAAEQGQARAESRGRRVKMPAAAAAAVNALLAYHIQYQLGRRLKLARHVLGR